jgi:hypothetical protein
MKIGIIVEGSAEYLGLTEILKKIEIPGTSIIRPAFVSLEPKDPKPDRIIYNAHNHIETLRYKGAERIVILLDLEDQPCPVTRAQTLRAAFHAEGYTDIEVVIKQSCFENWLIADETLFQKQKTKLFQAPEGYSRKIANRADALDAEAELKRMKTPGENFRKGKHGHELAKKAEPLHMAQNSRSFRKFLRALGHPAYAAQSKRPAMLTPAPARTRRKP